MNLHLVFSAPSSNTLNECLSTYQADDAIVFIENGVYIALSDDYIAKLNELAVDKSDTEQTPKFFIINEDRIARGIQSNPNFKTISYDELVDLTLHYKKTISWR